MKSRDDFLSSWGCEVGNILNRQSVPPPESRLLLMRLLLAHDQPVRKNVYGLNDGFRIDIGVCGLQRLVSSRHWSRLAILVGEGENSSWLLIFVPVVIGLTLGVLMSGPTIDAAIVLPDISLSASRFFFQAT